MTPVGRLTAAIEKLEAERKNASRGVEFYKQYNILRGDLYSAEDEYGERVAKFERLPDAVLADTLHRTIDAQLAILRFAVDGLYDLPEFVALADAILGDQS